MTKVKDIDGLPVIDAGRPLVLNVTPADIKGANLKQPANCAIARACKRQLQVVEARIHLSRTYLRTNGNNWVRYITPRAARQEIITFDRGGTFEPMVLTLAPVTQSEKLGLPRGDWPNKKSPRKTKGKPRGTPHVVTNVRAGPA